MSHVIIGTAGHIDHGKTALVKALTGVDTDRLPEEKERGLTIDIGFAHLGDQATIIDVPGHEKFIKNMVAGVSTIDLVLFVVAADDGVMPQTREHLDILELLQIKQGIAVITKVDLVTRDWLELVKEDLRQLLRGTFLENAPMVEVSAITGQGIEELQALLREFMLKVAPKKDRGIFWLPVDRSFTMKGFGTVVTGSVLSGRTQVGEILELLPGQRLVRIRGLQSHGRPVQEVKTGDRAAINVQGVEKQDIQRGDVLASPGYFTPSFRFDGRLRLLKSAHKPVGNFTRVRLHVGTREIMARVIPLNVERIQPGETAYVQLRLEEPAVALRLDPFVLRQYSPPLTIGGGVILDANAPRHKRTDPEVIERLKSLEREDPREVLEGRLAASGWLGKTVEQLSSETGMTRESTEALVTELVGQGSALQLGKGVALSVVHRKNLEALQARILEELDEYHRREPLRVGVKKSELKALLNHRVADAIFDAALEELKGQGKLKEVDALVALASHTIQLTAEQRELATRIRALLLEASFVTPSEEEMAKKLGVAVEAMRQILSAMQGLKQVVRLEDDIYLAMERVDEAREKLVSFLKENGEITVSQFKDLLATSRKYAVPLLIHFDTIGVTERVGDVRILREG